MLPEQTIRAIASRYIEPIRQTNADERKLILENVIREALIADQAYRREQSIPPNAGCL